jgi:hypothetical protein
MKWLFDRHDTAGGKKYSAEEPNPTQRMYSSFAYFGNTNIAG